MDDGDVSPADAVLEVGVRMGLADTAAREATERNEPQPTRSREGVPMSKSAFSHKQLFLLCRQRDQRPMFDLFCVSIDCPVQSRIYAPPRLSRRGLLMESFPLWSRDAVPLGRGAEHIHVRESNRPIRIKSIRLNWCPKEQIGAGKNSARLVGVALSGNRDGGRIHRLDV